MIKKFEFCVTFTIEIFIFMDYNSIKTKYIYW